MTSTDPNTTTTPQQPDTSTATTTPAIPSPAQPAPPAHRPRSRSSAPSSSGPPTRRYTHCTFARPHHPHTRWYLTFLHEGTYSEVYIGHPHPASPAGLGAAVAIKVGKEGGAGGAREDEIRGMLFEEGRIMQQLQSTHAVCRLHHQPQPSDEAIDYLDADEQRRGPQPPFIAMTLLLCDVSQLRKEGQLTRLAMWEVFVLMLRAMRGVHEGRILHRDVKPSNFGLAHAAWSSSMSGNASPPAPLPSSNTASATTTTPASSSPLSVYIIDFGQSTHAFTPSSSASAPSTTPHCPTSFKGKSLFATITRHEAKPQGRSDDLTMLLYIALDFMLPSPGLPWKAVHDKRSNLGADRGRDEIVRLKREWRERWKQGERLSGDGSDRGGEGVLVGLLERLEGVGCEDEPPYDEVERELQRAWDEEAKEVGDVGKTLSECVAEFMEANDELRRKLNDKPPTTEEREREREEKDKKRKDRREHQRQHEGGGRQYSVDLTIDTKRYTNTAATPQLPLPPTASPPLSANQPHSAWPVHSPYDSSPATGRARMWPLQSLCESTSAVKAVLEFYCIAETPRAIKAVNALLLSCTTADLRIQAMQQRAVLWLSEHPTVSLPTSAFFTTPPPQSPLFALFPVTSDFDTFVLLCTDACQRLRGKAVDGGGGCVVDADRVVESVLAEWTALDGDGLQRRAEQLMKDRESTDLATLLPPPTSTLGGRIAKLPPPPLTNIPAAKPSQPAAPAGPSGQAAAKSIVDSWMQLPIKPTHQPMRAPIRRPISNLSANPPPATPTKQPPPIVSATAPPAPTSLPEPSAVVALGKGGSGRRVPKKPGATQETSAAPAEVSNSADSVVAPRTPPASTPAADEPAAPAPGASAASASASASSPAPAPALASTTAVKPTLITVKKAAALLSQAKKSAHDSQPLVKQSTTTTNSTLQAKQSTSPTTDDASPQPAPVDDATTAAPAVQTGVEKRKRGRPPGKGKRAAVEQSDEREAMDVVVGTEEAKRPPRGGRKQKAQVEDGKQAEQEVQEVQHNDSDTMSLSAFINQDRAEQASVDGGKSKVQKLTERKDKAAVAVESVDPQKEEDEDETEEEDDDSESERELNDDGVYEVQAEVDYSEPPEDDVHRVIVRNSRAEKLIKGQEMARYYKSAPYRLREKVQAQYQGKKWYDAVIIAVDRTHDVMALSKEDAEDKHELDDEALGDYPINGVALHFKDYKGKEADQLQPDQLWCYNIMWTQKAPTEWFVESRLKHAQQPRSRGKEREAGAAAEQVDRKRGRNGEMADGEEQRLAKRPAVNPIELVLAEVPNVDETETDRAADSAVEAKLKEAQHANMKTSLAKLKLERPSVSGTPKKSPSRPSEAALTHATDNSKTTTPTRAATVKQQVDQPSSAAPTATNMPAADSALKAGSEGAQSVVTPSSTSPSTPSRHIPKRRAGGRLTSSSVLPSHDTTPTHSAAVQAEPTDSTAAESNAPAKQTPQVPPAAAAKTESAVKRGKHSQVSAASQGGAVDADAPDKGALDAVDEKSSAIAKTSMPSAPAVEQEQSAETKQDATEVKPKAPSNAEAAADQRSRRASAPPSSLSALSSPSTLRIAVPPPPLPQPPRAARQRSRLSEGEKLQLEAAASSGSVPASSPQSADDSSPALGWTAAAGRSTRMRGSKPGGPGTPSASPVKEDDAVAGQSLQSPRSGGRKRGRGGGGADEARKDAGKEVEGAAQEEVDIVGLSGASSKRHKRGSS